MMDLPTRGASVAAREWFSKSLRDRMRELDLSQADLSRRMATSRDNVSGWCRGDTFPRPGMLEKIAKALDCGLEDLVPPEMIKSPIAAMPAFEATYNHHTGTIHVRMDMELPGELGLKILQMVQSAKL